MSMLQLIMQTVKITKKKEQKEMEEQLYLFQSFLAVFLRGRDEFSGGDRRRRASRLRRGRL